MLKFDPEGLRQSAVVKVYSIREESRGREPTVTRLLVEDYGTGKVLYEETHGRYTFTEYDLNRVATLLTIMGLEVYTFAATEEVSEDVSVERWELFVPEQKEDTQEKTATSIEPDQCDPRLMQWQTLTNAALANYQNGICTADETRISVSNSTFAPCSSWHGNGGCQQ
jgi:hypothetical protein